MSDIFHEYDKPEIISEEKPKKKKREITAERREILLNQLKQGRITALKNRQKKKLIKKIDKEEKNKQDDEKIARNILKKNPVSDEIADLKKQIEELKLQKKEPEPRKEPETKKEIVKEEIKEPVKEPIKKHGIRKEDFKKLKFNW